MNKKPKADTRKGIYSVYSTVDHLQTLAQLIEKKQTDYHKWLWLALVHCENACLGRTVSKL